MHWRGYGRKSWPALKVFCRRLRRDTEKSQNSVRRDRKTPFEIQKRQLPYNSRRVLWFESTLEQYPVQTESDIADCDAAD
jgi:hypothetical protein